MEAETIEKPLTALERKWQEEKEAQGPTLDDAYTAEGKIDPDKIEESVFERIPTPTGWRIAILPYRGAEKTKGGIVLAEETQKKTVLEKTRGWPKENPAGNSLRLRFESWQSGLRR